MPGLLQTGGGSMGVKTPTPKLWEAPGTQPTPHDHSVSHTVPSCGAVGSEAAEVQAEVFPETDHGQAGLAVYQLIEAETNFLYWEIFMEACYSCNGWIELNDGDVVVDCGANIGLFTLWATAQADLATVVAVEPMGPQFDCLQRNVELHMLQATVRARQLAVGGQSQESSTFVFFPRMPSSSHRAVYAAEKEGQREAMSAHRFDGATSTVCQTTTLSQLMADEGLDRIDLLKVDVEGDELAVLEGLTESDTRRVHQIVMEAHATDGRVERIVHLLEARGFEVRVGGGDPRMERAGCFNVAARRRSSSS